MFACPLLRLETALHKRTHIHCGAAGIFIVFYYIYMSKEKSVYRVLIFSFCLPCFSFFFFPCFRVGRKERRNATNHNHRSTTNATLAIESSQWDIKEGVGYRSCSFRSCRLNLPRTQASHPFLLVWWNVSPLGCLPHPDRMDWLLAAVALITVPLVTLFSGWSVLHKVDDV